MGGFVRAIAKAVFGKPKQAEPAPVVVQQPAQTKEVVDTVSTTRQKLMGSGYGGQTIMSTATGVEDEANVGKTVLGGGKKRKIRV